MKRAVRMAAVAGIVVLASLWTLTAAARPCPAPGGPGN